MHVQRVEVGRILVEETCSISRSITAVVLAMCLGLGLPAVLEAFVQVLSTASANARKVGNSQWGVTAAAAGVAPSEPAAARLAP